MREYTMLHIQEHSGLLCILPIAASIAITIV